MAGASPDRGLVLTGTGRGQPARPGPAGKPSCGAAATVTCRLADRAARPGARLWVTALDPPWFGPDGLWSAAPRRCPRNGASGASPGRPVPGRRSRCGRSRCGRSRCGRSGAGGPARAVRAGRPGQPARARQRQAARAPPGQGLLPAAAGRHGRGVPAGRFGGRGGALRSVAAGGPGRGASAGHDRRGAVRAGRARRRWSTPGRWRRSARKAPGSRWPRWGTHSWRCRWRADGRDRGRVPARQAGWSRCRPARPRRPRCRPLGPPAADAGGAGCDPALPLIETPLALLDPPVAFSWWPCSSSEALQLAAGRPRARGRGAPARPVRRVQHRPGP